jgi:hypothetical protein
MCDIYDTDGCYMTTDRLPMVPKAGNRIALDDGTYEIVDVQPVNDERSRLTVKRLADGPNV